VKTTYNYCTVSKFNKLRQRCIKKIYRLGIYWREIRYIVYTLYVYKTTQFTILYYYITILLFYITVLLYYYSILLYYYSILLYYYITILLFYITILLFYITILLYYSNIVI